MIGFSTGALRHLDITLVEKVRLAAQTKGDALEVGFRKPEDEFYSISQEEIAEIKKLVSTCQSVSIHAPSGREVHYRNDKETHNVLERMRFLSCEINPAVIVFHANTIDDLTPLKESELPFALECMDGRYRGGVLPGDMEDLLREHPDVKVVLDITHVRDVDPQLSSFDRILKEFGERVVELHLSGSSPEDRHIPLYRSDQPELVEAYRKAKKLNVPVLLEGHADPENVEEDLTKELEFVRSL